jgi:phosphoesterase RecJ-like protein
MIENISYCNFTSSDEKKGLELIRSARSIALLPHTSADGDALASCASMELVLLGLGKKVEVVAPDDPQAGVNVMPKSLAIGWHSFVPDLLISLDVATKDRLYMPPAFEKVPFINIDHHIKNTLFGDINFVEGTAASACEVLAVLLFRWFGPEVFTTLVSETLLYGILDDSITFRTQLTSADTLKITTFLIESGADFQKVKNQVARFIGLGRIKSWATLLHSAQDYKQSRLAVIAVSQAQGKKNRYEQGTFGGFINFLSGMLTHDVVALLLEVEPGVVKGSLRSKKTDVATILGALFGGGGHKNAAGFKVKGSIAEVEKKLVSGF